MKLTTPQADFLVRLGEHGSMHCSPEYRPARKLVDIGFAVGKLGRLGSYTFSITDAGRAELEARK